MDVNGGFETNLELGGHILQERTFGPCFATKDLADSTRHMGSRNLQGRCQCIEALWGNLITTEACSPEPRESWFSLGKSSPFMAQRFRLVNYCHLPRPM